MKDASFSTSSDHELWGRFIAGDRGALGVLAERHERALLGLAQGLLGGDKAAACDAVQSMWMRAIKYAGGFRGTSEVKTWLCTILINVCRDLKREQSSSWARQLRVVRNFRERSHDGDDAEGLHAALDELGDERREVLLVCYHAGMTHEIAAEVLGIPLGTLKSRLHAGLKELRAALGEAGEGEVVA